MILATIPPIATTNNKGNHPMNADQLVNITVGIAVIGFLWNLHRDITGLHRDIAGLHNQFADLRERMARLEGLFEGFTGRSKQESERA